MSDNEPNLERRIDHIEQELVRIKALYDRTLSFKDNDPETSLMHARKAAEAICRQLFIKEVNPHPGHQTLDTLIQRLAAANTIPERIILPLRTIQGYGNFAAHDQNADDTESITKEFIQPCLQALAAVVDWYFAEHQRNNVAVSKKRLVPDAGENEKGVKTTEISREVIEDNTLRVSDLASRTGLTSAALIRLAREVLHIELRTPSALLTEAQVTSLEAKLNVGRDGENVAPTAPAEKILDLGKGVRLEMVRVPAGTFCMGSPVTEEGHNDDEVEHTVCITRPFYLARYPVSQAQYEAIVGANPSYFRGEELPVEMVSWFDAISFCELLTERFGKRFRLPTEAEWEYACRAGTTTPYFTGNTLSTEQANYDGKLGLDNTHEGQSRRMTTPVSAFAPNPWGLYDMPGNMWEWCADWYGPYVSPVDKVIDPRGPASGDIRILRGGSWFHSVIDARSAQRDALDPGRRHSIYGFRVAVM
ncbi:MAG: hypothetical protein A2293_06550 [Elusimicrobia bacterium RIFOXYB2_FULL_49_7]|nr:MAG: hypothetical protein A2293_06550 [Elusimicrobia bacterium RIFOXYB2_FULL_49_7]